MSWWTKAACRSCDSRWHQVVWLPCSDAPGGTVSPTQKCRESNRMPGSATSSFQAWKLRILRGSETGRALWKRHCCNVALSPCVQEQRAEAGGVRAGMGFTWETGKPVLGLGMSFVPGRCSGSHTGAWLQDAYKQGGFREQLPLWSVRKTQPPAKPFYRAEHWSAAVHWHSVRSTDLRAQAWEGRLFADGVDPSWFLL